MLYDETLQVLFVNIDESSGLDQKNVFRVD